MVLGILVVILGVFVVVFGILVVFVIGSSCFTTLGVVLGILGIFVVIFGVFVVVFGILVVFVIGRSCFTTLGVVLGILVVVLGVFGVFVVIVVVLGRMLGVTLRQMAVSGGRRLLKVGSTLKNKVSNKSKGQIHRVVGTYHGLPEEQRRRVRQPQG